MDEKVIISALMENGIPFDVLARTDDRTVEQPKNVVETAFGEHFKSKGLREIVGGEGDVAILVNDRNRPTPTHLVLEHLMDREGWIMDRISKVVVATGSHSPPTPGDMRTILGRAHDTLIGKVHVHDAKDREAHVRYGRTSRGTELFFDRALEGIAFLIMINSVEPHYFAGFTGGRKSILPGIALYDTIESNHRFALDEGSRTLGLEGNPVHEDMMEACSMYMEGRPHIAFQIVQAPGVQIAGMHIGDIKGSFEAAVEEAKGRFCAPIARTYDLVITVARPPMDRTLYQAQKAIEHGKLALREGGTILLVSECGEGIGQSAFWDLLTSGKDPDSVMGTIRKGYKLGYHKAARIVQLSRSSDIYMVSSIPASTLKKGFIKGFSDLESALEDAFLKLGSTPRTLLIPDGTVTVPMVKEGCR